MLPARARATLSIAPEAVGTAGLSDLKGGYVSTVRFLACREREPSRGYRGTVGKYTGFPFAFAAKEPSACVPLEVWLDGEVTPLRVVRALRAEARVSCSARKAVSQAEA